MRVIICGPRKVSKMQYVIDAVAASEIKKIDEVITGGELTGVDKQADLWAEAHAIDRMIIPANWNRNARAAGPIRNGRMADLEPDAVIAVWNGESKGTKNMIETAKKRLIPVFIYRFDDPELSEWINKPF